MTTNQDHDSSASVAAILAELEHLRVGIARLLTRLDPAAAELDGALSDDGRRLLAVVGEARSAMLRDPIGASALVRFLTEQGRRYADTEAGAQWKEALVTSEQLEDARRLWEATSLGVFDDAEDEEEPPAAWVDLLADALASRTDIDAVIDAMRFEV